MMGVDAGSLVSGQALFQAALVGAVEADGSAALCHALCNGEADAVCAAGDQGNLALQIKCSKIHKENSFTERPRTGEPVRGLVCA